MSQIASSKVTSSNSFLYTLGKCGILMMYYTALEYFGCNTASFKLASFLILTPLAKIFHFNKLTTRQDKIQFLYSVMNDAVLSLCYFKLAVPFVTGGYFSFFPLMVAAVFILLEMIQHRVLDSRSEYQILSTGKLQDNILAPIICSTFYYFSLHADFVDHGMDTSKAFAVFVLLIATFDTSFGVTHYILHEIPRMWKLHALHHQYKKERLNAFANFYSDIWDSLITNSSVMVIALVLAKVFGKYHVSFMEIVIAGNSTHLRFVDRQMHLLWFFEWDLMDMILKKNRIGNFHSEHHHNSDINYCAFGIISDSLIKTIVPIQLFFTKKSKKVE